MSIKWEKISYPEKRDIDPYLIWSLGAGRDFFLSGDQRDGVIAAVLEFKDGVMPREFSEAYYALEKGQERLPRFQISRKYSDASPLNDGVTVIPIIADVGFLSLLADDEQLSSLARATVIGPPLPEDAVNFASSEPETIVPQITNKKKPRKAVVGIIDDGIAFGNKRFQLANNTTRVEYAWVQDGVTTGGSSPVQYGKEFSKTGVGATTGIDQLIADCSTNGGFDEEKFYRLTGQSDFSRDVFKTVALQSSHGTHVMDVAAGEKPEDNVTDRPIVCVQLPATATADTSGSKFDPYVLDAVRYIVDRADRVAAREGKGPLPIVINFSYGIVAGPHDGTSSLEIGLDQIINARRAFAPDAPLEIVLPSGNSRENRVHASINFDQADSIQNLNWRVPPDDRTSSFTEIWLPYRDPVAPLPSRMGASLQFPANGSESPTLPEVHNTGYIGSINGDPVCMIFYRRAPFPTDRGQYFIALLPTAFLDSPSTLAPSGVWKIKLKNTSLDCSELVETWIQRDDTPYGYPQRGRPSHFDQPDYERFSVTGLPITHDNPDCVVKRAGTISALATGEETIIVSGVQRQDLKMANYSAGGPVLAKRQLPVDPLRPDVASISDDSNVFQGVFGSGTRSGSVVVLNGTSVAAPAIARWVATEIANHRSGDREAVQKLATDQEAARAPRFAPQPISERAGCGRVELPPIYPVERYDE